MKLRTIAVLAALVGSAAAGEAFAQSEAGESWTLYGQAWNLAGPKLPDAADKHVSGYQWLVEVESGAVRLCQQDAASTIWLCAKDNVRLGPEWHFQQAEARNADQTFPVGIRFLNGKTGGITYCVGTRDLTYRCNLPSV